MLKSSLRLPRILVITAVLLALAGGKAGAGEQPAGDPLEINGMEIQGIFLQAVKMEPAMKGQEPGGTDIHLEADIVALEGNENGFAAGAWVPYLKIRYRVDKVGGEWKTDGHFHAMVAADGPHYGANVKLDGPGEYKVAFHIEPPSANGFMRHYDKETGVGPWWKPFDYEGSFVFAGTGKKGGY